MRLCIIFVLLLATAHLGQLTVAHDHEQRRDGQQQLFDVEHFLKVRCDLTGEQVFQAWTGAVYSNSPGTKQQMLWRVVGFNVARCLFNNSGGGGGGGGGWILTSREAMLYLDPSSGSLLHEWANPWIQETVPVVHVANDPVQQIFPPHLKIPATINDDGSVVFEVDVPLFYDNPLWPNATFRPYSPLPYYQASEFFKFYAPYNEVVNKSITSVTRVDFSWFRQSQWLPWMKMGNNPMGLLPGLLFSSTGTKVFNGVKDLPMVLQDLLDTRIPLFKSAPSCLLDAENESSWTYFKKYFAQYLAKEQFPIPARHETRPCVLLNSKGYNK